jgi:hypothetical protein
MGLLSTLFNLLPCTEKGDLTPSKNPLTDHDYILKDPNNLYAAGKKLYDITLKARQDMDQNGHLYLAFGEVHSLPSYSVLQADLATRLSKNYKTNVALEAPPQYLSQIFLHKDITDATEHGIFEFKANKTKLPTLFQIYFALGTQAPISGLNFAYTMLMNNIHISFVDSARQITALNTLNFNHDDQDLFNSSPTSMAIRNRSMVEKTIQSAKDQGSKITILKTGMNHIGGNSLFKYPVEQSLSALFKQKISEHDRILIIAPDNIFSTMPKHLFENNQSNMIILRNINNDSFTNDGNFSNQKTSQQLKSEYKHLKKLLESYPETDAEFKNSMTSLQNRRTINDDTYKQIDDEFEKIRKMPPPPSC